MISQEFKDWTIEDIDLSFEKGRSIEKTGNNSWRMLYFKIAVVCIIGFFFISLFNLQVINGAVFKQQSDRNRIYVEPIIAPRGIIYDRNGTPLVYNQDTFSAVIDKDIFDPKNENQEFPIISKILGMDIKTIEDTYIKDINTYPQFIILKSDISKDQMIAITTNPLLKGITAQPSVIRYYPYGEATSNILGYVSNVNADDKKNSSSLNDLDKMGRDGVEAQYDTQLRGVDGVNIVEVDTTGNVVNIVKTQDPIPGNNITLSIDINVQKALASYVAQGIKDSHATGGASVIENVNDGSILGMVTLPTYDNNKFAQGISEKDYANYINDPNNPLINRAISEAQPPGSVMKTITAAAALQEGKITPDTIVDDKGTFDLGGITFQNYDKIARGLINVIGGIQWSSNDFFYNVMDKYMNINTLLKYQKLFDAGTLTGIDLPGERPGQVSSPAEKQAKTGQVWYEGDSLNAAIGQGDTLITPIQIANWIASIGNGGSLFKPHVIQSIQNSNDKTISQFGPNIARQGFVNDKNLAVIREGMHQAVNSGIDHTLYTPTVDIAGKTGTAEFGALDSNGQYTQEHAWASGFAPFNKPQISFLVFLEGGGLSSSSERVAKNFLNWYYGTYLKANPNIL